MFEDTRPASLGDEDGDVWAPFRMENPAEIVGLLRKLRDAAIPLVVSAPGGATVVTELWSLDTEQQRLNLAADENNPALQQIVGSDEAVVVGYMDSVKVQFDLQGLTLVHGSRSCALQAQLPGAIYRFQRRSAYRVRTLDRHTPTARLRHPAMPEMRLALRVIDVSIGGCALWLPANTPALEPGITLQGVAIELDMDTRFTATLQIQHISAIDGADDGVRIGCEWQSPSVDAQRLLQRYIDQTQRQRRVMLKLN